MKSFKLMVKPTSQAVERLQKLEEELSKRNIGSLKDGIVYYEEKNEKMIDELMQSIFIEN